MTLLMGLETMTYDSAWCGWGVTGKECVTPSTPQLNELPTFRSDDCAGYYNCHRLAVSHSLSHDHLKSFWQCQGNVLRGLQSYRWQHAYLQSPLIHSRAAPQIVFHEGDGRGCITLANTLWWPEWRYRRDQDLKLKWMCPYTTVLSFVIFVKFNIAINLSLPAEDLTRDNRNRKQSAIPLSFNEKNCVFQSESE